MKILVVSSLAFDTGSYIRAEYLAKGLKEAGAEITFVKSFIPTLPFKLDFLITLPFYFFKILFSSSDIIFAVKSYPNVGIPLFFKKVFGGKIVIDTDDLSFAYSAGFWSRFSKLAQELFLPLADLHTYHNLNLFRYLTKDLKIPQAKTYYLKQGADLQTLPSRLKQNQTQSKTLLFVGHFDVACDLIEVLKAMPQVFRKFPDAKLMLVGDGPKTRQFQNFAKKLGIFEKITWVGLVSKEKVFDFINSADICLVYYKNKKANLYRASMKLREYLSLEKKVVCNNVGDLEDFKNYTYQTKSDLSSFTKMILKVLSGFSDNREKKGKSYILQNYSWEKIGLDFAKRLKGLSN